MTDNAQNFAGKQAPDSTNLAARWQEREWSVIPGMALDPPMNMALDEVMTDLVGAGELPPTLRIWGWTRPCVVLGRFQSVRNEVNEDAAEENGIELVRRISGGGAMFIQPEGAITWSIFAPASLVDGMTFAESYAFLDDWVLGALRGLGLEAEHQPLNDIAASGGKIGGSAQARRNGAVLHHTTMAYDMDTALMLKVLRIGKEKLSDKGTRSADKRVGPLRQQTQLPRATIIEHMLDEFRRRYPTVPGVVREQDLAASRQRVEEQFGRRTWTHILP